MQTLASDEVGAPLGKTKRAAEQGISDTKNQMAGYVIVQAASHEAAAKLFANHPHFAIFPGAYHAPRQLAAPMRTAPCGRHRRPLVLLDEPVSPSVDATTRCASSMRRTTSACFGSSRMAWAVKRS